MSDTQILHLFGGKGGSGKTTLSLAFAQNLSEKLPKDKVLLVSLDTGKSLSDVLKKKLSGKPTRLSAGKGAGGLSAAELEPQQAQPFLDELKGALQKTAQKGALLSEEDLQTLFAQHAPGLEELAALLHLLDQLEDKSFDRVVVDLSPTSHTLRLFDLPLSLRRFLGLVKGTSGEKSKAKKEAAPPGPLDGISGKVDRLLQLLKDPARTAFHLVALAEPVPEAQTRLLFSQIRERGIPLADVVVNQVEDGQGCPACQGRRGLQAPHVRKYQQLDKAVPVQLLAKREVAPRGAEAVKKLAKEWATGKETKALEFSAAEGPPALVRAPSMPPIAAPPLPPTRLIFFVGQGGVGKSSCAAAAAVTLTEKEGPVLLISTDPAHSLSDVLQSRLTDTETQVKGTKGLYARELDVQGWFAALRKRWKEKAEKAFESQPKAGEVSYDREVLRNLMDCAPACIDELGALSALTDALVQERFKRIVVDPSPSASGLRIVELPEIARGWLTALLGILVKYRQKGLGELADEVSAMLKHVKRFEEALASPNESRFVVVTRGEDLAAARTERLVEYLKGRKLAVERVLVNRVLPKSTCPKCENRRKVELVAAKNMEKKVGLPITVAPALGRHPAGLRELKAFRTSWYALSATAKIKAA
jgi:arsenite-transporting ATPase